MSTRIKFDIIALVVLALAVIFILARNEGLRNDADRWENNFNTSQSNFRTYRDKSDGQLITYKEALVLNSKEIKGLLKKDSVSQEMIKKYKKVSGKTTIVTEFKTDTVRVPVPYLITSADTGFIYSDECMSFKVGYKPVDEFLWISDMSVSNTQTIVTGLRRDTFWRSYHAIDVRNSNPCVIVTGLSHYEVVHRKKWHEKALITIPLGILGGAILWETLR